MYDRCTRFIKNEALILNRGEKAFNKNFVDSTGLRSNFTKDLQAIESAEHFINLALERLDIDSLDELERPAERSQKANRDKSKNSHKH
jgi:hypothetical protein